MPRKKAAKSNGRTRPAGFQKGQSGNPAGRKKGSKNKATIEVREAAKRIVEDAEYREALRKRLLAGKADRMEALLWHYAYGVPKQSVELETKGELKHKVYGDITASLAKYEDVLSSFVSGGVSGNLSDDDSGESVDS